MTNYYLGLDVGIGSVGWAVLNLDKKRIEDFNVRIFDSGEDLHKKERFSQKRRISRGIRRLYRRRSHRKLRLKNYLSSIGFISNDRIGKFFESGNTNLIELRCKAIDEKLTPEEITACLINISNNRGYRDFYDVNLEDIDDLKEKEEYEKEHEAITFANELMRAGQYRTPAEMIWRCDEFKEPNSQYRSFHNSPFSKHNILISRPMLEKEVDIILNKQRQYYNCFDDSVIQNIKKIVFAQRDFETGPGNENDEYRKFTGYLDSLGKCRFYRDQDRGSRFTVIADVYSLVNILSQYNFIDSNGAQCMPKQLAIELIESAINNGFIGNRELKSIARKYNVSIGPNDSDTPITKCFKYIKTIKPIFERYGYEWNELVCNYIDIENNILNRIGIVLSQSQTPRRRINELEKLELGLDKKLVMDLSKLKLSGTTNVSYKYMKGSIEAFCEGDIYGKFQAKTNKEELTVKEENKPKKLPPFNNEDDCEFFKNPVVFRAINETRKIINSLIDRYGYPVAVNIETADEVNRTFEDRANDTKRMRNNEKENDRIIKEICDCICVSEDIARPLIEKYKLWEAQNGVCLYSGKPIDKATMLRDKDNLFEVDHIVPYSLILDNTINNKSLVLRGENQDKGQRTPLMYMDNDKAAGFRSRVNVMLKNKKCSKKKYQYLMLENLNNTDLLDEWKSRNLNDTRYICKYLVNYLKSNLRFNNTFESDEEIKIKDSSRVFAVKSRFTSMFRRQWLNEKTWGRRDKGELKKMTLLDHAADAIVIANCRPEYVILAGEKLKLNKMYHQAGKKITQEYEMSKKACIDSLYKYYRMDKQESQKLLSGYSSRLTPIIPNLKDEVDKRLWDRNIFELFWKDDSMSQEECDKLFRENMLSLYNDDPEFAQSISMPVVSFKPDRKYRGTVTDDNAIRLKEINGKMMKLLRVDISDITEKDIAKVYTEDKNLITSLQAVFNGTGYKTVGDYLKDTNQAFFKTSTGKRVNRVTKITDAPSRWLVKTISESNETILDDRKYYCIELYKDIKGDYDMLAIAMSDIVHRNKKLWLKADYKYPENYKEHVMYIFPGDYVRVTNSKGNLKFEGYFKSTKNIGRNEIYCISDNMAECIVRAIAKKDNCIKLSVDVLGRITGVNNGKGIPCGEPLLLLKEKN